MSKIPFQHYWARFFAILVLIAAGFPTARNASAQAPNAYVYMLRAIELADLDVGSIEGLAYSSKADALLAIQKQAGNGARPVALIDRIEELRGTSELQGQPSDVLNTAFNDQANSLFTFDPATQELTATAVEPNGLPPAGAGPSARFNLGRGIQQARGMVFDPATGRLFILDPAGKRMWVITPDEAGNYSVDTALDDNRVQRVDLKGIEKGGLQGLAFNPNSGTLFTLSKNHATLFEITENGDLVSTRDVSSFPELQNPAGMVFAPSGDMTDDPETKSLYVADSSANTVVELSITAVEVMALPAASPISLVRMTDTSKWNPPAPDTAGIDYDNLTNRLVISDSEVEEMPIYQGRNVFISSLNGTLQATCDTTAFNKEPSGLAIDAATGDIYISNDGKKIIYQVRRGPDGQYCTGDDQVRSFNAATYGVADPEGIGFGEGKLFIADGTNKEVWVISPGPNGIFDGARTSGDDVVLSHFDTASLGLRDPEGIDYHPSRGTVFVVSRGDQKLLEATQNGVVQRIFDLGFLNAVDPAGVGIGPGSTDSSAMNIYVVARGLDNNDFPKENDGKVYELYVGDGGTPPPTPTPTPTPGPLPDLIFADSFESGSFSAWSASSTGGGDLSVSTAAALVGTRGMQARINDTGAIYVTDNLPLAESRYRARFYFDPNSISMASGDNHFILHGISGTSKVVLRVQFRFTSSGGYQVRAQILNNSSSWINTNWFPISDAPHALEVDWTSGGSGGLTLWIDGAQKAMLTGIDNSSWRIDQVRLGAVNAVDAGTNGTTYFDAFESRRQSYIGP